MMHQPVRFIINSYTNKGKDKSNEQTYFSSSQYLFFSTCKQRKWIYFSVQKTWCSHTQRPRQTNAVHNTIYPTCHLYLIHKPNSYTQFTGSLSLQYSETCSNQTTFRWDNMFSFTQFSVHRKVFSTKCPVCYHSILYRQDSTVTECLF